MQIHRNIDNTWGPKQWTWFHLSRPHYLPTVGFASSASWFCDFLFLLFPRAFWTTPGTVARLQPWMDPKCIHGRLQVRRLEIMAVFTGRYTNLHRLYQAWSAIILQKLVRFVTQTWWCLVSLAEMISGVFLSFPLFNICRSTVQHPMVVFTRGA